MNALSEIKRHIITISGNTAKGMIFLAKVKCVNGESCSVDVDGLELTDIRLRAVVNGQLCKILITPQIGSYVLVADVSGGNMTELIVIAVSEIAKIESNCEDVILNGGQHGGIVKIVELTNKLNALKDSVNALTRAFNAHTHAVTTTGSATTQTGTAAPIDTQAAEAQAFTKTDYEDLKVRH